MVKRYNQLIVAGIKATDILVGTASWLLAYAARWLGGEIGLSNYALPAFGEFVPAMLFSLVLVPMVFSRLDLYMPKRTKGVLLELADIARAIVTVWAVTYIFAALTRPGGVSRLMMLFLLAVWLIAGTGGRLLVRGVLRRFRARGWNQRHAAVVGIGRLGQKLCHTIRHNTWTGIVVQYFVGDPSMHEKLLGLDVLGPVDEIDRILTERPVDMVFVAMPGSDGEQVEQVLGRLATTTVDVQVVPDLLAFHFLRHDVTQLDNLPIISLTHSPQHGWNSLLKSVCDVGGAAAALVIMAAPMLIIALAVKLTSRGPVFYRQRRASLAGREFAIIKFRTMVPDAEADSGPVWADTADARVTPIGRFLRRTSLDELPQILNVLAGRMSLVGPRPERPEFIERFRRQVPRYMLRSQVKAGLTGWAQVHGLRGMTSLRKRLQYDLYYITNWTFGLDLRILLMTLFRGFLAPKDS